MFLSSSQYCSCLFTMKCFSCGKKKLTQRSLVRQEACMFNRVRLFATLWTEAHQTPPSMEFPRQEYWSGLPFFPPGDLPDPGNEPTSLASPELQDRFFTTGKIIFGNFVPFFLIPPNCLCCCTSSLCWIWGKERMAHISSRWTGSRG